MQEEQEEDCTVYDRAVRRRKNKRKTVLCTTVQSDAGKNKRKTVLCTTVQLDAGRTRGRLYCVRPCNQMQEEQEEDCTVYDRAIRCRKNKRKTVLCTTVQSDAGRTRGRLYCVRPCNQMQEEQEEDCTVYDRAVRCYKNNRETLLRDPLQALCCYARSLHHPPCKPLWPFNRLVSGLKSRGVTVTFLGQRVGSFL